MDDGPNLDELQAAHLGKLFLRSHRSWLGSDRTFLKFAFQSAAHFSHYSNLCPPNVKKADNQAIAALTQYQNTQFSEVRHALAMQSRKLDSLDHQISAVVQAVNTLLHAFSLRPVLDGETSLPQAPHAPIPSQSNVPKNDLTPFANQSSNAGVQAAQRRTEGEILDALVLGLVEESRQAQSILEAARVRSHKINAEVADMMDARVAAIGFVASFAGMHANFFSEISAKTFLML